jgi:hypothetical protein
MNLKPSHEIPDTQNRSQRHRSDGYDGPLDGYGRPGSGTDGSSDGYDPAKPYDGPRSRYDGPLTRLPTSGDSL